MAGRPRKIAKVYEKYSTAQAILIAAEEICGELGLSGMKLREIARRVGIEPASIYNHYKGLGDVLTVVVRQSLIEEEALFDQVETLKNQEAIKEICYQSTAYFAMRKGVVRLSLNDLADAHDMEKNAFDINEKQIVQMLDRESAFLSRHLGLEHLSRKKLGEIAISRRSMIMTLLSVTWLNGRETDEERIEEISTLTSAFVLGLPSQLA